MNYKETMEYIEEMTKYGSVLGLENMRNLLQCLNNPQEELKFVHIAGTNGKGSTLSFISTVLTCAGYKVGRYISPTIFEYRERIQINGKMISKVELAAYMTRIKDAVEQMTEEGLPHPTPFEIETALSFLYFKEKKCDIVVLETGLGGREDATNIITTTLVAVLTNISMDHMAFLGETLEKIAYQKAGIIKNGCYVISAKQETTAMQVVEEVCREQQAALTVVNQAGIKSVKSSLTKQSFSYESANHILYKKMEISLLGTYQIKNAILAIEVLGRLQKLGYSISEKALRKGLLETVWIGRFTVIARNPLFIVDGAHNEDAARQLRDTIEFYFTNKKIIYIMGILKDKEYGKIIQETYSYGTHIITVTTPKNPRAMPAYELAQEIQPYHNSVTVADSLQEAVEMSYLLADKDSVIIAFGSLSYLGELIRIVEHRDDIRRDTHGRSEQD
ncbi:MAG: bifunctional folylpolyglutamate synthase/dihydrofolate synthase [Lachnospiraceae bacterium]|nr:bifunctional folylpolyglutamate synthase/dihydrofolate synthase [Lachnospiraceae bacterium]